MLYIISYKCINFIIIILSACCHSVMLATSYCFPRPRSWIESQKMGAFMSVAKGSSEEPWLLELHYNCPDAGREEERVERRESQPY